MRRRCTRATWDLRSGHSHSALAPRANVRPSSDAAFPAPSSRSHGVAVCGVTGDHSADGDWMHVKRGTSDA